MNELVVGLFETRAEVQDPAGESRVRRLVDEVATGVLDRAVEAAALPDGLWCLRRLDVEISLDDRTDRELGRAWADAVVAALVRDLGETRLTVPGHWSGTDAALAGYARSDEVVADLVASLAAGRREREWAWRALGALTAQDPGPAHDPRGAALAALRRSAEAAVPAVAAAVAAVGLAAVHRLLGTPGWQAVAALVLRRRGLDPGAWLSPPATRTTTATTATEARAASCAVTRSVITRSALAGALRTSGLRLAPEAVTALAVLAVAEAEPALLRRPGAATAVCAAVGLVTPDGPAGAGLVVTARPATGMPPGASGSAPETGASGRGGGRGGVPGRPADRQDPDAGMPGDRAAAGEDSHATRLGGLAYPSATVEAAGGAPGTAVTAGEASGGGGGRGGVPGRPADRQDPDAGMPGDRAAAGEDDENGDGEDGHATRLGGLVYLLATAEAAGVPDGPLADPALENVPPSEALHHLWLAVAGGDSDRPPGAARRAAGDQAVAALSGRTADEPLPGPLPDDARAAVERYAARWRQETAERLDVGDAGTSVAALVRRQGRVARWPGWVEFRLSLADVDAGVRRAGLDLDPGFVPWLGAVVVIRYG